MVDYQMVKAGDIVDNATPHPPSEPKEWEELIRNFGKNELIANDFLTKLTEIIRQVELAALSKRCKQCFDAGVQAAVECLPEQENNQAVSEYYSGFNSCRSQFLDNIKSKLGK